MSACLASAVMPWRSLPLGPLRLGPLRFSPYGFCAAVGLVVSMTTVRRCAGRAGADPEAAWDTGLFAIFSCFAASRLLLALGSPSAFLHYPLLLLSLPSLTLGGLALAGAVTWVYLRRKRLPRLRLLDTFAVPAALLAMFLELGHLLEGTGTGMPTRLPWGVPVEGAPANLRVHPVAFYGVLVAVLLSWLLWHSLPDVQHSRFPGRTAAFGLVLGGLAAFTLDMLSTPPAYATTAGIEPGQWIALAATLAGALMYTFAPRRSQSAESALVSETPTQPLPLHMEVH